MRLRRRSEREGKQEEGVQGEETRGSYRQDNMHTSVRSWGSGPGHEKQIRAVPTITAYALKCACCLAYMTLVLLLLAPLLPASRLSFFFCRVSFIYDIAGCHFLYYVSSRAQKTSTDHVTHMLIDVGG